MKVVVFVALALLVMVSAAFAQAPYGTEPVRNDAPIDNKIPSGVYHEYTCYRGSPVIDGDINDPVWQAIPFTEMELWQEGEGYEGLANEELEDVYTVEVATDAPFGNWMGLDDKSARFKMLWDDGGVYVVTVEDDDFYLAGSTVLIEPWLIWQGDNVQLGIDIRDPSTGGGLRGDDIVPFGESGWAVVDFEKESYFGNWTCDYTDPIDGDMPNTGDGWPITLLPGTCDSPEPLANGSAIHGNYDWDTNRITFELGFELWEGVGPGAKQLMMLMANDADEAGVSGEKSGRQGWVEWGRGLGFVKDSSDYGSVLFSDAAPSGEAVESSTWGKIKSTY